MAATLDPNMLTAPFQLTKGLHRDIYPAIEPKKFAALAADKVVLVTGAGGGLGYVRVLPNRFNSQLTPIAGYREDLGRSRRQRSCSRRP